MSSFASTLLAAGTRAAPKGRDSEAIVTPTDRLTFGDLEDLTKSAAVKIRGGAEEGAVCLLAFDDPLGVLVGALGASLCRVCPLLIDPGISDDSLRSTLRLADPMAVDFDISAVRKQFGETVATWERRDGTPIIDVRSEAARPPRPNSSRRAPAGDWAAMFLTSGTTGSPRVVVHSNASLMRSVQSVAATPQSATGQQTWLTPLPLYTIGGFSIMLRVLAYGDRLILDSRFRPRRVLESIERERVTCVAASPASLGALLRLSNVTAYDYSSLGIVGTGSSPLGGDLARTASSVFDALVVNSYGSTELGGPILIAFSGDPAFSPMEAVEVRIANVDGSEVPIDSPGELCVRVDDIANGYLVDSETVEPLTESSGWYDGDVARRTPGGRVELLGRDDELMFHGGRNVFPAEVEAVLLGHPDIDDVAVVGTASELGDDEMWAFVVPRRGAQIDSYDLREFIRPKLPRFKRPSRFIVETALPRTPNGKVRKYVLRERMGSPGGR